jgi:ATP-dependent exoDNAse (exonuclease V) alpha subunit
MVRDLCQGGQGVAVVVGRAGTGKTFALGIARRAWQLDGHRLLASAPTGIATVSLQGEGFEEVATCDRLLLDLVKGQEHLDARTVLVVDEAGMVDSRKLARLLEHAEQAQAKVVLVGDDRQLAPIDAGGGFRALRLRLGASELVENRRQQQAWEREAPELVRSGLVEEAVAAYQAHDRVVAAHSKPAATLALLQDWWVGWQQADHDPAQEVIVLAARRAEVDRLNTACQELLAARDRLGQERLQAGPPPPPARPGPPRSHPRAGPSHHPPRTSRAGPGRLPTAHRSPDRMINPDLLRFMAARIGATTVEVRSSHASPASHPHEVARLILAAAAQAE